MQRRLCPCVAARASQMRRMADGGPVWTRCIHEASVGHRRRQLPGATTATANMWPVCRVQRPCQRQQRALLCVLLVRQQRVHPGWNAERLVQPCVRHTGQRSVRSVHRVLGRTDRVSQLVATRTVLGVLCSLLCCAQSLKLDVCAVHMGRGYMTWYIRFGRRAVGAALVNAAGLCSGGH